MIDLNTRILSSKLTGVQRYLNSILSRFPSDSVIKHNTKLQGIKGHVWEQTILPLKLSGTLWSPSNTGPLGVTNQVVTLHDVVPLDHPEWLNPKFAMWYRWLIPKLAREVQHIITISNFSKCRIIETTGISEDKVSVIYNGVDPVFNPRSKEEITSMKDALLLPSESYILSLGSVEPRKNINLLLEAWSMIQKDLPDDIWLVIAGEKGKSIIYKDLKLQNLPPKVYFTGRVNDSLLPALYSGAISLAYLSYYEGFGLPPLEAMACGVLPVTSNLTSLPEVVGDVGLMVNPYDVEQICDALLKSIQLKTDDTVKSKAILQSKKFSWDVSSKQTLDILVNASKNSI